MQLAYIYTYPPLHLLVIGFAKRRPLYMMSKCEGQPSTDFLQIFARSAVFMPLGILFIVKILLLISTSALFIFDTLM